METGAISGLGGLREPHVPSLLHAVLDQTRMAGNLSQIGTGAVSSISRAAFFGQR